MSDKPLSIEQAAANLMQALNGASHGSIGAALADMVGAIDKVAGSDLSAAAAQLISGIDLSAVSPMPAPAQSEIFLHRESAFGGRGEMRQEARRRSGGSRPCRSERRQSGTRG